jgi:hypothetical protein
MVAHSHLLTLPLADAAVGEVIFMVAILEEDAATTTTTPAMVAGVVAMAAGSPTLVVVVKTRQSARSPSRVDMAPRSAGTGSILIMCRTPRIHLLRYTNMGSTRTGTLTPMRLTTSQEK